MKVMSVTDTPSRRVDGNAKRPKDDDIPFSGGHEARYANEEYLTRQEVASYLNLVGKGTARVMVAHIQLLG